MSTHAAGHSSSSDSRHDTWASSTAPISSRVRCLRTRGSTIGLADTRPSYTRDSNEIQRTGNFSSLFGIRSCIACSEPRSLPGQPSC